MKKEKEIIKKFFDHFAPAHAIVRANEALFLKRIKFNSPILDLGCGDGKFAYLTFGQKKIDVGLDANRKEIYKAKKSSAYKKVKTANGNSMPFKNREFNTVISNSVLEHVENLEEVLEETSRILNRNGSLILTVPTPLVSKYFFWSKFIPGWAGFKTKLWRHINYFDENEWKKRLKQAGFKITKIEKTNNKAAIAWADILFPVFPIGPLKFFLPFLEKRKVFKTGQGGATLLILAKKK